MSQGVVTRNFGRNSQWRKATVRSLAQALLTNERIRTTHAKAKETQRIAEKLITLGKKGSLAARRRALSILNDTTVIRQLFSEIAPRFQSRNGGYTRVLHDGVRAGDSAKMSIIELVELSQKKKDQLKPADAEKKPAAQSSKSAKKSDG
jgi:large subunit ribosomal protein L17